MQWISNSCMMSQVMFTNINQYYYYTIHIRVPFFLKRIFLFLSYTYSYTFSFATRFTRFPLYVSLRYLHYFIFPKQQSLRQCWRFTQVQFTLLCKFHKQLFSNIFLNKPFSFTQQQCKCVLCLHYLKSPFIFAKKILIC